MGALEIGTLAAWVLADLIPGPDVERKELIAEKSQFLGSGSLAAFKMNTGGAFEVAVHHHKNCPILFSAISIYLGFSSIPI